MDDKKMALSISDAAKKLGVFRSGLYELLRGGKIPFVKTGKRLMIPNCFLDALLKDRT